MPTFHTIQPVPAQESPALAVDEVSTVRVAPAQAEGASPQYSEFVNLTPAVAQEAPGANVPPASPTPAAPSVFPGTSYPQQGQAPGYPPVFPGVSYPQQGQAPGYPPQTPMPGYPSGPLYAPQQPTPGYPGGAGYVPQTPVPGYPSGAGYPQQGAFPPPAQPISGSYPVQGTPSGVYPPTANEFPAGVYPSPLSQPGPEGWGPYVPTGAPQATQPSGPSKLIQPLPLWAFIASIVVVAVLLLILTFFTGSDWAAGAQTAGIVALVAGTLILIAFGVRVAYGLLAQTNAHRRAQLVSSLLLTLLLIAVGAIGLTQPTAIHNAEAHRLEGQQNWQAAISEYMAGGQNKPSSEDMARTYAEWGEQYVGEGQFSDGIKEFEIVTGNSDGLTGYTLAPTGFAQAKSEAISAYTQWAQQAAQAQKYDQATQHYDKLLTEPYCSGDCQTQAGAADATAYYKLAEQKLHATPPDYAGAVAAFSQLTTRFSSSSSSQSAHADYATALWGAGQQHVNDATCSTSALPLYQQLASQFSDTSEGKQAASALTQAVSVKGHFTSNVPGGNTVPAVWLLTSINRNQTTAQLTTQLQNSPTSSVSSNGDFVFTSIKQGSYYLAWGAFNKTTGAGEIILTQNYAASVGPLCTYDFKDINESFPVV
jgi:hypothetical protein